MLRDEQLPALGVLLEDQDGRTVVKYVGKEEAQREKEKKERLMEEKILQKEEQRRKQEEARVSVRYHICQSVVMVMGFLAGARGSSCCRPTRDVQRPD